MYTQYLLFSGYGSAYVKLTKNGFNHGLKVVRDGFHEEVLKPLCKRTPNLRGKAGGFSRPWQNGSLGKVKKVKLGPLEVKLNQIDWVQMEFLGDTFS